MQHPVVRAPIRFMPALIPTSTGKFMTVPIWKSRNTSICLDGNGGSGTAIKMILSPRPLASMIGKPPKAAIPSAFSLTQTGRCCSKSQRGRVRILCRGLGI